MRDNIKTNYKGSFTVEAVLIMPIVLAVVFALIIMSFYMHDMCVIRSIADRNISEICKVKESGAPLSFSEYAKENWLQNNLAMIGIYFTDTQKDKITEAVENEIKDRLFLFEITTCSISEQFQKVTLTVNAKARMPIPFIESLMPKRERSFNSYATIYNPTVSVRYGKIIYSELSKTRLYEKVLALIEKARGYLL